MYQEKGEGLYLYDLHVPKTTTFKGNGDILRTRFDVRAIHWDSLVKLGIDEFRKKISKKIKTKMNEK